MRIYASQEFSRSRQLSSIYIVIIGISDGDTISANITIDESATGLFLEKMRALDPDVEPSRLQTEMQHVQNFAEYSWRTDNLNLISTINGLKESSLISVDFADEICRELPYLISRARLTQPRKIPDLTHYTKLTLHNDTPLHTDTSPKSAEWSKKINVIMQEFIPSFFPFRNASKLHILTESEARATIQTYCEGSFLVFQKGETYFDESFLLFQKNETYHLLAKLNSGIHQFDIITKISPNMNSGYFPSSLFSRQPSLFNLKNDNGELLFNETGVSACSLDAFLNSTAVQEKFPVKLTLSEIKIFKRTASFETFMLSHFLTQKTSLSWLPSLSDELQNKALFYFLDTFISNLPKDADPESFINSTLLSEQSFLHLTYRDHYSINAIEKNIDLLRSLYKNGCQNAGMALALIVYSGLGEPKYHDDNSWDFGGGGDRNHWVYSLVSETKKEKEPLFRDLEEYREITQNQHIFPDKIRRDIFLLRYFQAKNDKKMIDAQFKKIDLSQAIFLDDSFCSDNTILSCINREESKLRQLTEIKYIFHALIKPDSRRTRLATHIKDKLSEDVLKEKDEEGRNILHNLIFYLYVHSWLGSMNILEIFNFICQRFPEMLAEQDNDGYTVYDNIKRLKSLKDTRNDEKHIEMCNKLESTIENCGVKNRNTLGR